jgi:hypothetical protein
MVSGRHIIITFTMVTVLAIGILAYGQNRKEIDCERWREDITVALRDAVGLAAYSSKVAESTFAHVTQVNERRPQGCPIP